MSLEVAEKTTDASSTWENEKEEHIGLPGN